MIWRFGGWALGMVGVARKVIICLENIAHASRAGSWSLRLQHDLFPFCFLFQPNDVPDLVHRPGGDGYGFAQKTELWRNMI